MKNCFGLKALKSFLNLPFLSLQKEYYENKLQSVIDETNLAENEFTLLFETDTYDNYLKLLAARPQPQQQPEVKNTSPIIQKKTPSKKPVTPISPKDTVDELLKLKQTAKKEKKLKTIDDFSPDLDDDWFQDTQTPIPRKSIPKTFEVDGSDDEENPKIASYVDEVEIDYDFDIPPKVVDSKKIDEEKEKAEKQAHEREQKEKAKLEEERLRLENEEKRRNEEDEKKKALEREIKLKEEKEKENQENNEEQTLNEDHVEENEVEDTIANEIPQEEVDNSDLIKENIESLKKELALDDIDIDFNAPLMKEEAKPIINEDFINSLNQLEDDETSDFDDIPVPNMETSPIQEPTNDSDIDSVDNAISSFNPFDGDDSDDFWGDDNQGEVKVAIVEQGSGEDESIDSSYLDFGVQKDYGDYEDEMGEGNGDDGMAEGYDAI